LSIAPFADVPRKTAGGVGALANTGCGGTGTIPKACSVGNEETGNWTGIAATEEAPEPDAVGAGTDVSEAGVNGDVVRRAEAGTLVEVVEDNDFAGGILVASAGGTYCAMVELSGTE
jgi:hypothetical protein